MIKVKVGDINIWLLVEMGEFQEFLENAIKVPSGSKLILHVQNPYLKFWHEQLVALINLNDFLTKKGVKFGILDQNARVYGPLRAMRLEAVPVFASLRTALRTMC